MIRLCSTRLATLACAVALASACLPASVWAHGSSSRDRSTATPIVPAPTPQSRGAGTTRLVIVAGDSLGGVLPGATVTVIGPLPATTATPVVTGEQGDAVLEDVAPGRYEVQVEMPGFKPARLAELIVPAGKTTRETLTLELDGFSEQVAVTESTTERQLTNNFTESLTAADIEQLPDDAEEMTALLQQLAGPDMELRVNGFEGGELPPKSQIQAIRIRQDPFAPDSRGAGAPRVEIITRPGTTAWRHNINLGLRDQSLDARNAFASERGAGQTRRFHWNVSGPIVKNRTSIALNVGTRSAFDANAIVATRPEGPVRGVANREADRVNAELRVEHALTAAQTLRFEFQRYQYEGDNLGVGEFNLPERAYADAWDATIVRLSGMGTIGKKIFNEARLEYVRNEGSVRSLSDAVTVNVQNAFTEGGAQMRGGSREQELELADDLELILSERHKVRLGFETEVGWSRNDRMSNANGTFTFASLEDYAAGRPLQFTQRLGDPLVDYSRYEFSWYVHDELRVRDDLQLGLGLRHDFQSYLDDKVNLGPRASLAWTPFGEGKLTLRGGAGLFYDWYSTGLYEQTLRLDGFRQQDLIVSDPSWPDPFAGGGEAVKPPPSVVRAGTDLSMQQTRRMSVGVEQDLTPALQLRVNVFDESTAHRFRGLNVNAPITGVRPNPSFERITELQSIGEAEERGFDVTLRARSEPRRMFGMLRYRYARELNDGDDALSLPVDSYDLAAEWGPAPWDIRHRIFGYARMRLPYGLGIGLSTEVRSGAPYTLRTGFDDNGDSVTNDRPVGVGRNTERGEWQQNTDLRLSWTVDGQPDRGRGRAGGGPAGGGPAGGGAPAPGTGGGPESHQEPRGFEIYTQVSNVFNTTNISRYSGVMSSPSFGQPIAALAGRRMELGARVFF